MAKHTAKHKAKQDNTRFKEPMYFMYNNQGSSQVKLETKEDLKLLCKRHGLQERAMDRVWREDIQSHKGWTRILSKADVAAISACGNDYGTPL